MSLKTEEIPLKAQESRTLSDQKEYQNSYDFWTNRFSVATGYFLFKENDSGAPDEFPLYRTHSFALKPEAKEILSKLTLNEDGQFIILSALLHLLLSKYTGQDVSAVKMPLHSGIKPDKTSGPAGEVITTGETLLINDLSGASTLRECILAHKAIYTNSCRYQHFPIGQLLKDQKGLDFGKITNILLYSPSLHAYDENIGQYDITIKISFEKKTIEIDVRFNTSVLSEKFIGIFFSFYQELVIYLSNINTPLSKIVLFDEAVKGADLDSPKNTGNKNTGGNGLPGRTYQEEKESVIPPVVRQGRKTGIPLSYSQERLWFIDRLQGSVQYHMPWVFRVRGSLDTDALESCFRKIVDRHEVLRTVIREQGGVGYQDIMEAGGWKMERVDGKDSAAKGAGTKEIIREWVQRPFDLSQDPLLRVGLLEVSAEEWLLTVVVHHIASDGWSVGIIVQELGELYQSMISKKEAALKTLPVQYGDFALWQRSYVSGPILASKLSYWKERLSGLAPLELQADHIRSAEQSVLGGEVQLQLSRGLSESLKELCMKEEITPFMLFLSVFKALLYRYSGQEDICVGSPVAGRQQQEVEGLIGFFVNTLALRSEVRGEMRFSELLHQVKQKMLNDYEHQEVPFEKIVETLGVARDMGRSPVFQVMFVYYTVAAGGGLQLGDVVLEEEDAGQRVALFDLNLDVIDRPEGLMLNMVYCKDLYEEDTIRRMLDHYKRLLEGVCADSHTLIDDLPMLGVEEVEQLLRGFNDTQVQYDRDKTIVHLFREQAARTPDAVAVVCGDRQISYRELDELSNKLGHYLRGRGVKEESFVGICIGRSIEMIAGLLAIWKAGGAYIPFDPELPVERIAYMIRDSDCRWILTTTIARQIILDCAVPDREIIYLDPAGEIEIPLPANGLSLSTNGLSLPTNGLAPETNDLSLSSAAYVIYTSGSTGMPKGMIIEHLAILNYCLSFRNYFAINEKDKIAQQSSPSFDTMVEEIYPSLISGATVMIISDGGRDVHTIKKYIESGELTVLSTTPLVLEWLNKESSATGKLRYIISGGDVLHARQVDNLFGRTSIINSYGPSESTVCVTYHRLKEIEKAGYIGWPIANTKLFVLDSKRNIVPLGVAGELYIGGPQLAREYLHRPELTNEKFIVHTFSGTQPMRLFRTGDKVRRLRDGNLEYLGRLDEQVKIRGYRIEPGEIERLLQQVPDIRQAVVLAVSDKDGNKRLASYVVSTGSFSKEDAVAYLKRQLPEYMIPVVWKELDSLPLTHNGKLDRKKLLEMEMPAPGAADYEGPRNKTEEMLCGIWSSLLGIEQVGINDNFFERGGHSLLAMRMISAIRVELDKEIPIREIFLYPTIKGLSARMEQESKGPVIPPVVRQGRVTGLPLSYSQERLWFIDRLQGSVQYHMPWVFRLSGALDTAALESSLRMIVERHEVLRTVIREHDGVGYQDVMAADGWKMERIDGERKVKRVDEEWKMGKADGKDVMDEGNAIAGMEAVQKRAGMEGIIREWVQRPFDLSRDPLLRVGLLEESASEWVLVVVMHHIASDGWSVGIMVQELGELYQSRIEKRAAALKELPVQYGDYALWQRSYVSGAVLESKLSYWKAKLSGLAPLELPTDHKRSVEQSIRGGGVQHQISRELSDSLREMCLREEVTLFMLLLSVFKILLYRYSGQGDICVGSPVAGRQQQEVEGLIGFFVNTLALRSEVRGGSCFRDLLEQVRRVTLEAYEHQEVPFEKIVEALGVARDMSRNPVFQVMFVMQNGPEGGELRLGDVVLEEGDTGQRTALFDLALDVVDRPEGLLLNMTYCRDLYEEETISRMLGHYERLLEGICAGADTLIDTIPMLGAAEEDQLLRGFNDTQVPYDRDKTIVDLFREQAGRTPDVVAVVCEGVQWTYGELDERSNRLGDYLRNKGVSEETLVPICIERSMEMMLGILGILKAGGAYVPIDPQYPQERIGYMLEDTEARVVVSNGTCRDKLGQRQGLVVIELNNDGSWAAETKETGEKTETREKTKETRGAMEAIDKTGVAEPGERTDERPDARSGARPAAEQLAYVIYTSGSTGRPKGVMVEHRSVANLVDWHRRAYAVDSQSRSTSMAGVAFDAFGWELFPYLCAGAAIYIISDKERLSLADLLNLYTTQGITHSFVPTALVSDFIKESAKSSLALQYLLTGGDQLSSTDIRGLGYRIINNYGPTENTVVATCYEVSEKDKDSMPAIGKPISNARIYILNSSGQLCPSGVAGEICIGGAGIARAYLNQPDLTNQKFIPDPYHAEPGRRLYRTGDKGKWMKDGNLEYLGRLDEQVKIRGYRIEPGEIERLLQQVPDIRQAVVLAVSDKDGNKRLAAYVVSAVNFSKEDAVAYLKRQLPEYMIPVVWKELDSLPLTHNGKLDRKKLLEMEMPAPGAADYEGPRNKTEEMLCGIWSSLLGIEQVGINDNFFEHGGHSLLAMRMISAIRVELDKEIPIREIFLYPTIKGLSARMEQESKGPVIPPVVRQGRVTGLPLSYSQERLWFIDRLQGSVQYHMPWVFRLSGALDTAALESSLRMIVERHEVLRTVIREHDGVGYQDVMAADGWKMERIEAATGRAGMEGIIREWVQRPFDLSRDPLLRVGLLEESASQWVLVVVMHHIASDGWSVGIMVQELGELYQSRIEKRAAALKELPVQYGDYALWQRSYVSGAVLESKLSYWKAKLSGLAPLELPTDHKRSVEQSIRGGGVQHQISRELSDSLREMCLREEVTLFMLLLSVFKILLYRYSGQGDICVGSPVAGRQQQEVEGLIGFFVNTLALRSEVRGGSCFRDLLEQVRRVTLEAYEHQEVPFEKIVEALGVARDMSRNPVFQVMFVMQNGPEGGELRLGDVVLEEGDTGQRTALFDLTLDVVDRPEGLLLNMTYCRDLYEEETISRMLGHYERLLEGICAGADTLIDTIPMLGAAEEDQLLRGFNDTRVPYDRDKTIVDLFREQAGRTPDAVAVVCEGVQWTYGELDERSNRLGDYLRNKGVGEETLVPICIERSIEMVLGILGILKAGGAYVPIDPQYPQERIGYMLEDTEARIVVSNGACRDKLGQRQGLVVIELNKDGSWKEGVRETEEETETKVKRGTGEKREETRAAITGTPVAGTGGTQAGETGATRPGGRSGTRPAAEQLAYVIYTSGSTGRPKGVMVEHRSVMNRLRWGQDYYGLGAGDAVLQKTTFCFDVSVWEIFWPLISGARLVLASPGGQKDSDYIRKTIEEQKITTVHFVPSMLEIFLEEMEAGACPGLQRVLCSGEALKKSHVILFRAKLGHAALYNLYGPTEAAIEVSCWKAPEDPANMAAVSIGRPVANTRLYIMDSLGRPVALGAQGELCIGGIQVARGYLKQPALTNERFIPDPYGTEAGARLYRTGDLARWLGDGNLEYLGRLDEQVKISGYRIEPGEIEHILRQAPGVRQAVVVAGKDQRENIRLTGYVVTEEGFAKEATIKYLRGRLPEYMVPSLLVEIDNIPLTASGKTDRMRLLQTAGTEEASVAYEAPRNEVESIVCGIWESLLGIEKVGINNKFFDKGGHSLIMIRLLNRMRQYRDNITLRDLFEYQTVREQALLLGEVGEGNEPAKGHISANGRSGPYGTAGGHLLQMQTGGEGAPLFIIPGYTGLCDIYYELAGYYEGVCPVFGIQMQGLFEGESTLDNIPEIAALNIEWIRQVNPAGPYRFIGHSFGGLVAFEMCKQLEGAGETVEWVAVLDCPSELRGNDKTDMSRADFAMEQAAQVFEACREFNPPHPAWVARIRNKLSGLDMEEILAYIPAFAKDKGGDDAGDIEFLSRLFNLRVRNLLISYPATGKIKADLIIARAADSVWKEYDSTLGWSGKAENTHMLIVPGDHFSMVTKKNVIVLTDHLKK